jgi:hypothetical protein
LFWVFFLSLWPLWTLLCNLSLSQPTLVYVWIFCRLQSWSLIFFCLEIFFLTLFTCPVPETISERKPVAWMGWRCIKIDSFYIPFVSFIQNPN